MELNRDTISKLLAMKTSNCMQATVGTPKQVLQEVSYNSLLLDKVHVNIDDLDKICKTDYRNISDDEVLFKNLLLAHLYVNRVKEVKPDISIKFIQTMHKLITESYLPSSVSGKYRTTQVYLSKSTFIPPKAEEIENHINEIVKWYKSTIVESNDLMGAIVFSLKVLSVHPFIEANGRLSRLLLNYLIANSGYDMINIKYADRKVYYDTVDVFNKTGDYIPYANYILGVMLKQYT